MSLAREVILGVAGGRRLLLLAAEGDASARVEGDLVLLRVNLLGLLGGALEGRLIRCLLGAVVRWQGTPGQP
jgi:hypothetical protein